MQKHVGRSKQGSAFEIPFSYSIQYHIYSSDSRDEHDIIILI